jgi:acetyl-CoA acetyltransferase
MASRTRQLFSSAVVTSVASGLPRQVAVVGASGFVKRGRKNPNDDVPTPSTTNMIKEVLQEALQQAQLSVKDLDGLVAVPSLQGDRFMEAHYHATALGLFGKGQETRALRCRTLDTGGAGPVSALLEGERMIQSEGLECVAVVAADAVGSMSSEEFLLKADDVFFKLGHTLGNAEGSVKSPAIPHGYDCITQYQMQRYNLKRTQLQMAVSLESFHASLHPRSLQSQKSNIQLDQVTLEEQGQQSMQNPYKYYSSYTTLDQVQSSTPVTPNISLLECARRADGAACLILASNRFLQRRSLWTPGIPVIIGGGAFSGPLYPPTDPNQITDAMYASCQQAMARAYASAGNLKPDDIHFFGLYDCFPICLVRAIEACGLAHPGKGGDYIQVQHQRLIEALESDRDKTVGIVKKGGAVESLLSDPYFFPINTHGGLLCFGAPWEIPAMFNVVEAVDQLRGQAQGRKIQDCRRALVFGNGGVLSASAVAILATSS